MIATPATLALLALHGVSAFEIANAFRLVPLRWPRVEKSSIQLSIDEVDAGGLAGPFWDGLQEEAIEEAEALGLNIRSMTFVNGKLSIKASGAGVDELQQLNLHLSNWIDTEADEEIVESLPPFLLQVSSPGLSSVLSSDLDFTAFKGFPVICTTSEPFKSKTKWEGTLIGRDDKHVSINLKGRAQKIPRELVSEVRMPDAKREAGDTMAT
jgi:ribosome maturation factor RimP